MRTLQLVVQASVALALVFAAPAARADSQAAGAKAPLLKDPKAAARLFADAISTGDAQKLLVLWPSDGSAVILFGKPLKKPEAQRALATKGALYKLLRWEGPDKDLGSSATPAAEPKLNGAFMLIGSAGYGKQPLCQLSRHPKTGLWKLDACKLVDNGAP